MASKNKDQLIQEVADKGLEVNADMTNAEIQAVIDAAGENEDSQGPVAPLQSVGDSKEHVTGAGMKCWNCANNGVKSKLDSNGVCSNCGFDVSKIEYNGGLEAAKAIDREKARKLAEKG